MKRSPDLLPVRLPFFVILFAYKGSCADVIKGRILSAPALVGSRVTLVILIFFILFASRGEQFFGRLRDISANTAIELLSRCSRIAMSSQPAPKTCKVITAETIAKKLLLEVKETLAKIQETGSSAPTLVAFLANEDPAAIKYAEWSKKTCEEK